MVMKKVLFFLLMVMTIVGILGGIGYTIYYQAYPIAVCLVAAGAVAFPGVKDLIAKLQS